MSNALFLDRSVDLFISMTWPKRRHVKHGVCGHVYEILDYYWFLKDIFNVKILIGEEISYNFTDLVRDKYDCSEEEIVQLHDDITFADRPNIIIGNNILFVDGLLELNFQNGGVKLVFNNILTFRCSPRSRHNNLIYKNVKLLQDNRVYNDDVDMSIHYIKKINFSKYKTLPTLYRPPETARNTALIYSTKNCRLLDIEDIITITDRYDFDRYIIASDYESDIENDRIRVCKTPVMKLFEQFNTYIYTAPHVSFDCSPRLIAECAFYNKNVIYHNITDEYLSKDSGLAIRKNDIETNFTGLWLNAHDNIINILNEIIRI